MPAPLARRVRVLLAGALPVRLLLGLALAICAAGPARADEAPTVAPGRRVSIEYTLSLSDGTRVYDNVGREPLVFVPGEGTLLPGLEEALLGLAAGASRVVSLPPEKAYGPADPAHFRTFPAERIPEDARRPGAIVTLDPGDGRPVPVRVREVTPEGVVLDLNHPLAGKTLRYDVKVLAIE